MRCDVVGRAYDVVATGVTLAEDGRVFWGNVCGLVCTEGRGADFDRGFFPAIPVSVFALH